MNLYHCLKMLCMLELCPVILYDKIWFILIVLFFSLYFLFISDQRNLGMSMKIERSSLEQVRARFDMNKKKKEEKRKEYDFEERMKELKEEVVFHLFCFVSPKTSF